MENNRRKSFTGTYKYINVRFFLAKDRIDKGEVRVEYCPTHLMIADYFTKTLTGKIFNDLRGGVLMGYK